MACLLWWQSGQNGLAPNSWRRAARTLALVAALSGSATAVAQDSTLYLHDRPMTVYVNDGRARPPQLHPTWNEACIAALREPVECSGSGTINNPRICIQGGQGEDRPGFGPGCWYRVTYESAGRTYYDAQMFYGMWAYPRAVCLSSWGFDYDGTGWCRRLTTYQKDKTCTAANPVAPATGAKSQAEFDDSAMAGGARLEIVRRLFTDSMVGFQAEFGTGWALETWGRTLRFSRSAGADTALATRSGGKTYALRASSGVFTASPYDGLELRQVAGQWRLVDKNEGAIEDYDAAGRLLRLVDRTGASYALSYSDANTSPTVAPRPGLLIAVTSHTGRAIELAYNAAGQISSATLAGQPAATYAYEASRPDLLASVTFGDGTRRSYLYESARNAGLVVPAFAELISISSAIGASLSAARPFSLVALAQHRAGRMSRSGVTGILGEMGQRVATYDYDAQGRVTQVERGPSIDNFTFGYQGAPAQITVTDPLGTTHTRSYSTIRGEIKQTGQSQAAGAGCDASTSASAYDVNGNLASRDDFNGSRVCYANDLARNLESARVEGLTGGAQGTSCASVVSPGAALPAGARKISSQWHPDWRLQTRLAEPGKVTTRIYNGQPDPFAGNVIVSCAPADALLPDSKPIAVLCKVVEQASTDADGSQGFAAALQSNVPAREQKWTYNEFGQVLTHDGPRTDVADLTTYQYYTDSAYSGTDPYAVGHTKGDLWRMTNAAGQVTQYTLYNKHGQLLEMIDPNGVLTRHTYDQRQRLTSTSVAGQTTVFDYWPTGLIKRVTQPDASYLYYDHDDAQRLYRISDNLGNSVTYTLDNMGNRIAEETKDPANTLRRQLSRSFDALGRVQQVSGRE